MSQQIQITGGAKVRDLQDVIIGTSGVLSSVAFDVANGVPRLDSNGKILVSQLPNSVMEYKGTWNASTNTPTLANGTGNQGDVYLCNVAGTVNFGAGPIAFIVGDSAVYSGSIWQRSGGATGTVTSVGLSTNGGAITIGNSPITTSGVISANFNGTNLQYVNGAGNLTTFPTLITSIGLSMPSAFSVANSPLTANGTIAVTGAGTTAQYIRGDGSLATFPTIATEAQRLITEVYNETGATLTKGTVVYINGGHGNLPTITKAIATGDATSAQTYGIVQTDITNNNNGYVVVIGSLGDLDTQAYANGTQLYLSSTVAGQWTSVKQYAPAHLVYVAIVTRSHPTQGVVEVRIQNGFEMDELHNVSAQSPLNNQGLFYNTSTSLWENKSIATALGYTPADDANVVHLTGNETIGGTKTFSGIIKGDGSILLKNGIQSVLSGYVNIGGNAFGRGIDITFPDSGGSPLINTLNFNPTTAYSYTFPAATGTIALTSNLANYVDLTTAQTIGGTKTFSDATKNNGGIFLQNGSSNSLAGYMNIGGLTNGVKFTSGGGISNTFTLPSATGYTFTFPNGTGTLALTSDISYPVTSVFGRTGAVVATEGDYSLTQLSDVTITTPSSGQVLRYSGTAWVNSTETYVGTVTSVAALTIGTSGTDLSSSVANSTTTPVITLNVPTASATNRGALSSADWTTFNNKQSALTNPVTGTGTTNYLPKFTGTSTIGNSIIQDNGSTATVNGRFNIYGSGTTSSTYGLVVDPNGGGVDNFWVRDDGATYTRGNATFASSVTANGGVVIAGNASISSTAAAIWSNTYLQFNSGSAGIAWNNTGNTAGLMLLTNSGNLGLGVTPSAWGGNARVFEGANGSALSSNVAAPETALMSNAFYNGSSWIYKTSSQAARYSVNGYNGSHTWEVAPSGTTGNAISFTQAMTLTASGRLLIGTPTEASYMLDVNGTSRFSGNVTIANQILVDSLFSGAEKNIKFYDSSNTNINAKITYDQISSNSGQLFFGTNNAGTFATRLTISSTGAATFSSSVTAGTYLGVAKDGSDTIGAGAYLVLAATSSSRQWIQQLSASQNLTYYHYNGSSWIQPVTFTAGGNVLIGITSDNGRKLRVSTSSADYASQISQLGSSGGSHGLTIDCNSSSSSIIGLEIYSSSASVYKTRLYTDGSATFSSSVTATSFFESSSIKGKDIIATNPLLALDIDVIKYTRKNDESKDIRYGYSAEQIHSLMPELTDKDVTAVKYLDVHTILIAQLQQEIKELKAKFN